MQRPIHKIHLSLAIFSICSSMLLIGAPTSGQETTHALATAWPIKQGFVVTNYHVVEGRPYIRLIRSDQKEIIANVILKDEANDLVILKVNDPSMLPPAIPLSNEPLKLGETVFTIGFPLPDVMGVFPKLNTGTVTSLASLHDDPRAYQISVPIQAGNSGGPLLNLKGQVVGIVTYTLDALWTLAHKGNVPQNVNYAMKVPYLRVLFESVPTASHLIDELESKAGAIDQLAERIQPSILRIIASPWPTTTNRISVNMASKVDSTLQNQQGQAEPDSMASIQDAVRNLETLREYNPSQLGTRRMEIISELFQTPKAQIHSFRWGHSNAPKGHQHYGLVWYTVALGDDKNRFYQIIWVNEDGFIVEKEVK